MSQCAFLLLLMVHSGFCRWGLFVVIVCIFEVIWYGEGGKGGDKVRNVVFISPVFLLIVFGMNCMMEFLTVSFVSLTIFPSKKSLFRPPFTCPNICCSIPVFWRHYTSLLGMQYLMFVSVCVSFIC